jgi:hypothetical protein
MSEQPSFPILETAKACRTAGRYLITFREDAVTEGSRSVTKSLITSCHFFRNEDKRGCSLSQNYNK